MMKTYSLRIAVLFTVIIAATSFSYGQSQYTSYDNLPGVNKNYKPAYSDDYPSWAKKLYAENITVTGLREFGTASHMDVGAISGDIPMKNWQQT